MPRYINPRTGKRVFSATPLSQKQLDEAFAVPLSQMVPPEQQDGPTSLTGQILERFRRPDPTPEELEKFNAAILPTAGRIGGAGLRMGGAIVGHRLGGRLGQAAGTMGGDVLAQPLERLTGARESYNPRETLAQGALGLVAPGTEGSALVGAAKGAAFGAGSATLDALAQGKPVPPVGQLALSATVDAILTGTGRYLFRPSVKEISNADVSEEVHDILFGKASRNASPAEIEEAGQLRLPGVKASPAEIPERTYINRSRTGRWQVQERAALRVKQIFELGNRRKALTIPSLSEETTPTGELPFETELVKPKGKFPDIIAANYLGIPKHWFSKTEKRTGIRVYADAFDPIEKLNTRRINLNNTRANEVEQVYKGTTEVVQRKYQAFLEHPDKAVAEKVLKFEAGDRQRTGDLHTSWRRMFRSFGLGDDVEPYLTKYVPRLRQASHQLGPDASVDDVIRTAFPVGVPKEVDFFREMYEDHGFHDTNSLSMIAGHQNYGSWKTIVEPTAEQVRKAFVNNKDVPDQIRDTVKFYLEQVHGGNDRVGRALNTWLTQFAARIPGLRRAGLDEATVKDITSAFVTLPYAGTLGYRPGPLIRNAMQTWMTGFSELGHWLPVGWKAALSPKGVQLAERLGILGGAPGFTSEFQEGLQGPATGAVGRFARRLSRGTARSLGPYNTVDEKNRMAMGLGQYARALRAIRKANGNVERFLDYAHIRSGSFFPAEQDVLVKLAREGKFSEVARRSAVAMADNTQWVMRAGNRPPVATGTGGRTIGQFYSWGAFYGNYLRRLASSEPGQHRKNAARVARFLLANSAMVAGATVAGKAVGNSDPFRRALMWLGASPAIYTGSTYLEAGMAGMQAAEELTTGGGFGGPAQREFGQKLESYIPYGGMSKDFYHLIKPDKGRGEAMTRVLGVQPRVPKFFR